MKAKKLILAILVVCMMFGSVSFSTVCMAETTAPAEEPELYPDATYTTVESEKDATGGWIYRDLVPDVGCETQISPVFADYAVTTSPSKQVATMRVDNDKHSGSYSWYRRAITMRGVGFQIKPNIIEAGQKYISSAWLRSDMEGATEGQDASNVNVQTYVNYITKANWFGSKTALSKTWKKCDLSFTAPSDYNDTKNFNIAIANCDDKNAASYGEQRSDKTYVQPIYSIYVDDWSIRRAIPEGFENSYVKSIKLLSGTQDSALVQKPKNGNVFEFKFSLDIDARTVREKNILVNGAENSNIIKNVSVVTNDDTRETTLTITLDNLENGRKYNISLENMKDAWGRDVIGTKTVAFETEPDLKETIVFKKGEETITSFEKANNISVEVSLESNAVQNITIFVAEIKDKKIVATHPVDKALAVAEYSGDNAVKFTGIDTTDADSLRVFIWSQGDYPAPVISYTTFSENGAVKAEY